MFEILEESHNEFGATPRNIPYRDRIVRGNNARTSPAKRTIGEPAAAMLWPYQPSIEFVARSSWHPRRLFTVPVHRMRCWYGRLLFRRAGAYVLRGEIEKGVRYANKACSAHPRSMPR